MFRMNQYEHSFKGIHNAVCRRYWSHCWRCEIVYLRQDALHAIVAEWYCFLCLLLLIAEQGEVSSLDQLMERYCSGFFSLLFNYNWQRSELKQRQCESCEWIKNKGAVRRAGGMEGLLTYVSWPLGVMLHSGKIRSDLAVFFYCRHRLRFLSAGSRHPFYSSFNQFHFSPLTSKCGSSCQVARETTVARQHTTLHHPFQKSDRWRTGMPRQEWEKKWKQGGGNTRDKGRVKNGWTESPGVEVTRGGETWMILSTFGSHSKTNPCNLLQHLLLCSQTVTSYVKQFPLGQLDTMLQRSQTIKFWPVCLLVFLLAGSCVVGTENCRSDFRSLYQITWSISFYIILQFLHYLRLIQWHTVAWTPSIRVTELLTGSQRSKVHTKVLQVK